MESTAPTQRAVWPLRILPFSFPWGQWGQLDEAQRILYFEVVLDNFALMASLHKAFTSTPVTWAGFCLSPSPRRQLSFPQLEHGHVFLPTFLAYVPGFQGWAVCTTLSSIVLYQPQQLPPWSPADKGQESFILRSAWWIPSGLAIPSLDGCPVLGQFCDLGSAAPFSWHFLGSGCARNYRHWHRHYLSGTTGLFLPDIPQRGWLVCFILFHLGFLSCSLW